MHSDKPRNMNLVLFSSNPSRESSYCEQKVVFFYSFLVRQTGCRINTAKNASLQIPLNWEYSLPQL